MYYCAIMCYKSAILVWLISAGVGALYIIIYIQHT